MSAPCYTCLLNAPLHMYPVCTKKKDTTAMKSKESSKITLVSCVSRCFLAKRAAGVSDTTPHHGHKKTHAQFRLSLPASTANCRSRTSSGSSCRVRCPGNTSISSLPLFVVMTRLEDRSSAVPSSTMDFTSASGKTCLDSKFKTCAQGRANSAHVGQIMIQIIYII